MIVVCGGIKGGSGKTTATTNLAIIRAAQGRDVLLIDADDQETSFDFTAMRNEKLGNAGYSCIKLTGKAVKTETEILATKYQDIVIDTGGRDTTSQRAALLIADLLLVPFKPRLWDVWTLERIKELVEPAHDYNPKLRAVSFLNMADARGKDNEQAAEFLRQIPEIEFSGLALVERKAFGNAAASGLAVTEVEPADSKACEEVMALYRYVFNTEKVSADNQNNTAVSGEAH